MRYLLIFVIYLLPTYSLANDLDNQINKACLRHAVSLVTQLKNDVVNNMDKEQSDKALKIATETCQAYFMQEFSDNQEALATTDNTEDDENKTDWLTEKILSGDTERKKGNKRLERLK